MPEICENWLGLANSCIHYAHQTCQIYRVQPYWMDFKASKELWNPLSKAVLSKRGFIWNEGPVYIWNNHKTQKLHVHH